MDVFEKLFTQTFLRGVQPLDEKVAGNVNRGSKLGFNRHSRVACK